MNRSEGRQLESRSSLWWKQAIVRIQKGLECEDLVIFFLCSLCLKVDTLDCRNTLLQVMDSGLS